MYVYIYMKTAEAWPHLYLQLTHPILWGLEVPLAAAGPQVDRWTTGGLYKMVVEPLKHETYGNDCSHLAGILTRYGDVCGFTW